MHIGNFGVERPPLDMTFGWFGNTVRVEPNLTDTILIDFLKQASEITDETGPEAMRAVEDFLAAMVHHEDFATFMHVARGNRQTIEDLMKVAYSILEVATARPTHAPADSSDGRSATQNESTESASVAVVRQQFERTGRPDLALAVVQAQEARLSKAG